MSAAVLSKFFEKHPDFKHQNISRYVMPRPFTREGLETRLAIRSVFEANPAMPHADLRRQFNVVQTMVDSALGKTAAEWQALLDATPAGNARAIPADGEPTRPVAVPTIAATNMPGLEQGIVKFTRKPAKMGEDYIFWIPRVYVRNGLVDPNAEYEVYLKKKRM